MVGMARWEPHSATAEFYINTKSNPHLDHKDKTKNGWGYCIFGRVVLGMETVNAIAAVPTGLRNTWRDVPQEEILIRRVYVAEAGSPQATAPAEEVPAPAPPPGLMKVDG